MNYHSDEVVSASALAEEMRDFWHLVAQSAELAGAVPRQQFWVLASLLDGPRRMSEIACCAHTTQASLTGIVDRLEEQGLVRRERSDADRRVVVVELTEAGRERIHAGKAAFRASVERLLEPLTAEERAELLRLHRILNRRNQSGNTKERTE